MAYLYNNDFFDGPLGITEKCYTGVSCPEMITENINHHMRPCDVSYEGKSDMMAINGDIKMIGSAYYQYDGVEWKPVPATRGLEPKKLDTEIKFDTHENTEKNYTYNTTCTGSISDCSMSIEDFERASRILGVSSKGSCKVTGIGDAELLEKHKTEEMQITYSVPEIKIEEISWGPTKTDEEIEIPKRKSLIKRIWGAIFG